MLRAPDIKDEFGWQILQDDGIVDEVIAYAGSRDKARAYVKTGDESLLTSTKHSHNGAVKDEVLPLAPKTPEEMAADTAHAMHLAILHDIKKIKGAWVDLAAKLYQFRAGNMFEALGYQSFNAYLADPDVEIEHRWAYDYLAMYEQLVIKRGVEPEELKELEVSKVKESLPAIRREQVTWEEAKSAIKSLSKRDIVTMMSGRASPNPGTPDTGTGISTETEPQFMTCATCGSRVRVDPETGEFLR